MNTITLQETGAKEQSLMDEGLKLLEIPEKRFGRLFIYTNWLRQKAFGNRINLCAIINAKSGRCSEDCAFCAQAGRFSTRIEEYGLVSKDQMLSAALRARDMQARSFSIVTSGKGITSGRERSEILEAVEAIRGKAGLRVCASLGIVDLDFLKHLKNAGLSRYHHNLETSRSFFSRICTTHDYDEDINVVRLAREAGLEACSGAIFGMGETWEQRIELITTLHELDVDAVPINFLNPIPGTPLEGRPLLDPYECLKIIAVARLLLHDKSIIVCGGREVSLGEMQDWMFLAGADGLMIGDYLTTRGRVPSEDLEMLKERGLEPAPP